MPTAPHSRLGRVSTWLGRLSIIAVLLGPTLAHFEIVRPLAGFAIFGLGLLLAVLCLLIGLVALAIGPAGTRAATGGGLLPAVLVFLVVLAASGARSGVPRINDITTDTSDPPQFVHAQTLPENAGRDMSYPGESFASQQLAGYGRSSRCGSPSSAGSLSAVAARRAQHGGWVITREDKETRALEGYDTSRLFRFKDDFVIVVRDSNGQSVVQMRSKSRDGQGDVGTNAKRIRAFLARVKE
jgi:hypothetical protein